MNINRIAFSIIATFFAAQINAGTVTYSWQPNSSLDGSSGILQLQVQSLYSIDNWSAASQSVNLTHYTFSGTYQPSDSFVGSAVAPSSLIWNGGYLKMSGSWSVGKSSLQFFGPRNDNIDTGGLKIAQGTWALSSYALDTPAAIPLPATNSLFSFALALVIGARKIRKPKVQ